MPLTDIHIQFFIYGLRNAFKHLHSRVDFSVEPDEIFTDVELFLTSI